MHQRQRLETRRPAATRTPRTTGTLNHRISRSFLCVCVMCTHVWNFAIDQRVPCEPNQLSAHRIDAIAPRPWPAQRPRPRVMANDHPHAGGSVAVRNPEAATSSAISSRDLPAGIARSTQSPQQREEFPGRREEFTEKSHATRSRHQLHRLSDTRPRALRHPDTSHATHSSDEEGCDVGLDRQARSGCRIRLGLQRQPGVEEEKVHTTVEEETDTKAEGSNHQKKARPPVFRLRERPLHPPHRIDLNVFASPGSFLPSSGDSSALGGETRTAADRYGGSGFGSGADGNNNLGRGYPTNASSLVTCSWDGVDNMESCASTSGPKVSPAGTCRTSSTESSASSASGTECSANNASGTERSASNATSIDGTAYDCLPLLDSSDESDGEAILRLEAAAAEGEPNDVLRIVLARALRPGGGQGRSLHNAVGCEGASTDYRRSVCVEYLCRGGANVNKRDGQGRTALFLACAGERSRTHCASLLLSHGADPGICNRITGESCLIAAARAGHIDLIRILLANGADAEYRYVALTCAGFPRFFFPRSYSAQVPPGCGSVKSRLPLSRRPCVCQMCRMSIATFLTETAAAAAFLLPPPLPLFPPLPAQMSNQRCDTVAGGVCRLRTHSECHHAAGCCNAVPIEGLRGDAQIDLR